MHMRRYVSPLLLCHSKNEFTQLKVEWAIITTIPDMEIFTSEFQSARLDQWDGVRELSQVMANGITWAEWMARHIITKLEESGYGDCSHGGDIAVGGNLEGLTWCEWDYSLDCKYEEEILTWFAATSTWRAMADRRDNDIYSCNSFGGFNPSHHFSRSTASSWPAAGSYVCSSNFHREPSAKSPSVQGRFPVSDAESNAPGLSVGAFLPSKRNATPFRHFYFYFVAGDSVVLLKRDFEWALVVLAGLEFRTQRLYPC